MNLSRRTLALAVAAGILSSARANPVDPTVIAGSAAFTLPTAGTLEVRNAPGTIINWQGFSIDAGEVTRFVQQSASSAVLNRVTGGDPSALMGQLVSNGRVFLVNRNGIVFGPDSVIDTAGLVASTLDISDADFLAGRLRFAGSDASGAIVNQGYIKAGPHGEVVLVAPRIENHGIISTPDGRLLLAAGEKVTLTSLDLDGVAFEVRAPRNEVLNLGRLIAERGAVGVFAGSIRHSGEIEADSLAVDAAGRVRLIAAGDIEVGAGARVSASGVSGGSVRIESKTGTTRVAGVIEAEANHAAASAAEQAGRGGHVEILGARVAVVGAARVSVSGAKSGGVALIGGDYQGRNPAVPNATRTLVGRDASVRADARDAGAGGKVIVWADDTTQAYGTISARGGNAGGNGGFVEVSGKHRLDFRARVDTSAPRGSVGTLLLDPDFIDVTAGGLALLPDVDQFADPGSSLVIDPATINAAVANVFLQANEDININNPILLASNGVAFSAEAGGFLNVNGSITTRGGAVTLTAGAPGSLTSPTEGSLNVNAGIDTTGAGASPSGAPITLTSFLSDVGGATVVVNGNVNAGTSDVVINALSIGVDQLSGGITAGLLSVVANTDINLTGANNVQQIDFDANGIITFNNTAATYDIASLVDSSATAAVTLAGTSNKTLSGTMDIGASATLTSSAGSFSSVAGSTGRLRHGTFVLGALSIVPSSQFEIEAATAQVSSFSNAGRLGLIANGVLDAGGAAISNFAGATIEGVGTLVGSLSNAGTLAPGLPGGTSAGRLTISGSLALQSTSVVTIEIGGATQGTLYDHLAVSGPVTLAGTLNAALINGFVPSGQIFQFLTATGGRTAFFNATNIGVGGYTTVYGANDASLTVAGGTRIFDNGSGDQNWFNPVNWSGDVLPGPTDNAIINVGPTAIFGSGASATVGSLSGTGNIVVASGTLTMTNASALTAGELDLNGAGIVEAPGGLTLSGALTWSGGTFRNTVLNTPAGSIAISLFGSNTKTLDASTWNNGDSFSPSGSGQLLLTNGSVLNNLATGTINLPAGYLVNNGTGSNAVNNAGTLNIAGTLSIETGFNNTGTTAISAGIATFNGSGLDTGTYNGAGGTQVRFGAPRSFGDGALLGGSSGYRFDAAIDMVGTVTGASLASTATLTNLGAPMNGPGKFTNNGTVLFDGGTVIGATFTNNGTYNISLTNTYNGPLFDHRGVFATTVNGDMTIDNAAFRRAPGSSITGNGIFRYTNNGVFDLAGTTFTLNGSSVQFLGSSMTLTGAGTLNVASGATFALTGTLALQNAVLNVAAPMSVAQLSGTGGTVNLGSGTFDITGASTYAGSLALSGSGVLRANDLTVSGSFDWGGGTVLNTVLRTTGAATMSGAVIKTLAASTWTCAGALNVSPGALDLLLSTGSLFDVASGGSFTTAGSFNVTGSSSAFDNHGTMNLGGPLSIAVGFHNDGVANVTGGNLTLIAGGTDTGTYNAGAGRTVSFAGGLRQFADGVVLNGPGAYVYGGGSITVTGSGAGARLSNAVFDVGPNTLGGSGVFTNSGTLRLSGSTVNPTIVNLGVLQVLTSATYAGALLDNRAGANINIAGGALFDIIGTLRLSGGTVTGAGQLNYASGGAFDVGGGTVTLDSTTPALRGAGVNILGGGTLIIAAGGVYNPSGGGGTIGGTNVIVLPGGLVDVPGTLTISGGRIEAAGGTIRAGLIVLQGGGRLAGTGLIDAGAVDNQSGVVAPGNSPGTLIINGPFQQGASGTLAIELAGTARGIDYDLLQVNGAATLDGTLDVQLLAGFVPGAGDLFDVISYRSATGDFASLLAPIGVALSGQALATDYRLQVGGSGAPVQTDVSDTVEAIATDAVLALQDLTGKDGLTTGEDQSDDKQDEEADAESSDEKDAKDKRPSKQCAGRG